MSRTIPPMDEITPFERGQAARRRGEPAPNAGGTWAERLFRRGWWAEDRARTALHDLETLT